MLSSTEPPEGRNSKVLDCLYFALDSLADHNEDDVSDAIWTAVFILGSTVAAAT